MNKVYIINTAVSFPNNVVSNDEMENVLGKVGGKASRARRVVLKNNGIKERYYALDPATRERTHTNAGLTADSVSKLFSDKRALNNIECLVSGTTIPDQIAPGHAVMVHGELGIPPCEVVTTAGICLSGITSLKYAYMAVKSGEHKLAVTTGSEVLSPLMRAENFTEESKTRVEQLKERPEIAFEKDFLRWMLSDGAGAFLLAPEPEKNGQQQSLEVNWIEVISYANQHETCMYAGADKNQQGALTGWSEYSNEELGQQSIMALKQDVRLLNENIVSTTFSAALASIIKDKGLSVDEIDYFLPHISSMYFYDKVKNALIDMDFEIPQDKWFTNLTSKGNTGAASIYIMVDELLKSNRLKSGDKLLCFVPESGRFSSSFMLLTVV